MRRGIIYVQRSRLAVSEVGEVLGPFQTVRGDDRKNYFDWAAFAANDISPISKLSRKRKTLSDWKMNYFVTTDAFYMKINI